MCLRSILVRPLDRHWRERAHLLGHELAHCGYGHLKTVKQNAIWAAVLGTVTTVAVEVHQDYSALGAREVTPRAQAAGGREAVLRPGGSSTARDGPKPAPTALGFPRHPLLDPGK